MSGEWTQFQHRGMLGDDLIGPDPQSKGSGGRLLLLSVPTISIATKIKLTSDRLNAERLAAFSRSITRGHQKASLRVSGSLCLLDLNKPFLPAQ